MTHTYALLKNGAATGLEVTVAEAQAAYVKVFTEERARDYPVVDAFEARMGYAVDRAKLEDAARVLACPLKAHAPNWQHGRVLYAAARRYLVDVDSFVRVLDIGTAKGFSALCLYWALKDSAREGQVISVDVLDPNARVRRNTVAEVGGYQTLSEILRPWPEASYIEFLESTGHAWLESHRHQRIRIAFVDGKHAESAVRAELALLTLCQQPGDLVLLDDVQIPGVADAVKRAKGYTFERIAIAASRIYALGIRQ